MKDETFKKIHKAFCKSYNFPKEIPWRENQYEYKLLKIRIENILETKPEKETK